MSQTITFDLSKADATSFFNALGAALTDSSGPSSTKGAKDVYTLRVNVANSALFQGTITDTPQVIDGWVTKQFNKNEIVREINNQIQ
jgi:hypothetical protein